MKCPRHPLSTVEEALERGWCKTCPEKCADRVFNIEKFAEFLGDRGVEITLIKDENGTSISTGPLTKVEFYSLMKDFILHEVEEIAKTKPS